MGRIMATGIGLNQEPDMVLQSLEDIPAPASSSSSASGISSGRDHVGDAPRFYIGKSPAKFDFHFPDEVWQMILNMLTKDEDRTNCCRAFPLFDRLLTKGKPLWMFKQVLPLIYENYFHKTDVLTCRRICRQWCEDIENHTSTTQSEFHLGNTLYSFESVEDIDRFSTKFEGHSRNPFIHRAVCINNCREIGFPDKLLNLLLLFGEHVWTLEFDWIHPEDDCWYFLFRMILHRMPNLKELIISGTTEAMSPDVAAYYPIRCVPTLTTLTMWGSGTEVLPRFNSFISGLVLAHALQLQCIVNVCGSSDSVFSHQLPKLTKLEVREIPNDQELEKLLLLNAPLKELELEYAGPLSYRGNNHGDDSVISVSGLLRVLQHFPLLEKFTIELAWNLETQPQVDISHLNNSTVRTVGIIIPEFRYGFRLPVSCNFLRAFKALETLTVELFSPRETFIGRNEGVEELQFFKMLEEGQLYESNIWSLIPTLKTVEIMYDHYRKMIVGNRRGFVDHQA